MDKRPIRRKFKDNPYILESIKEKDIYIIKFKDVKGIMHEINVDKDVFTVFDDNEKYENARIYEYTTKGIKSEVNIENFKDNISIEEEFINKMTVKELRKVISELPDKQKRRLIKYYFEDKTLEEISEEEHCTKMAVKFSIDIALKNISKKFKK